MKKDMESKYKPTDERIASLLSKTEHDFIDKPQTRTAKELERLLESHEEALNKAVGEKNKAFKALKAQEAKVNLFRQKLSDSPKPRSWWRNIIDNISSSISRMWSRLTGKTSDEDKVKESIKDVHIQRREAEVELGKLRADYQKKAWAVKQAQSGLNTQEKATKTSTKEVEMQHLTDKRTQHDNDWLRR